MKKVFNVVEALLAVIGAWNVISNVIVAIQCHKDGESYIDRLTKVGETAMTGKNEEF